MINLLEYKGKPPTADLVYITIESLEHIEYLIIKTQARCRQIERLYTNPIVIAQTMHEEGPDPIQNALKLYNFYLNKLQDVEKAMRLYIVTFQKEAHEQCDRTTIMPHSAEPYTITEDAHDTATDI